MTYLDTKRFDRLSDEEVLDRIGALLAVAIGRREQQRQLTTQVDATRAAPSDDPHLAALDFSQLVTDPLEALIIMHLRVAGHASVREMATALGVTIDASVVSLK